ncbi:unnamed protein product [Paramecium octaurelia]|uniref:Uncharacterized protein n=1 Tax=Paramecium octaurelia TaxID=43137 RepID=A0A8S1W5I1_PAROT|nr:unnamed protein product [Paramecium octaurelia]
MPQLHTKGDLIEDQQQDQDKSIFSLRNGTKDDQAFDTDNQQKQSKKQRYNQNTRRRNGIIQSMNVQELVKNQKDCQKQKLNIITQVSSIQIPRTNQRNKKQIQGCIRQIFDLEIKKMQQ